ncbi:hypothetical protein, partial [Enterococcus avium]|uniref:hypothetical protein n=1 Tax=Enterococcus avium TaxID=33945 RepID=UPI003DA34111
INYRLNYGATLGVNLNLLLVINKIRKHPFKGYKNQKGTLRITNRNTRTTNTSYEKKKTFTENEGCHYFYPSLITLASRLTCSFFTFLLNLSKVSKKRRGFYASISSYFIINQRRS